LDTITITHHAEGRPREQKFRDDIDLLNGYLKTHPDHPRSVYYLAQSYRDVGDSATAAELYSRRAGLRGWAEEQFHARYREGQMRLKEGEPERGVWALMEAYAARPSRAEPLRALSGYYRGRGCEDAALVFDRAADRLRESSDRLFVEQNAYLPVPVSEFAAGVALALNLPDDDGWMLPGDAHGWLTELARTHEPEVVVECGSGASTVLLAKLQRQRYRGRLISLEHDERFAARTRGMLDMNGLDDVVTVCPLGPNGQWQWYTLRPEIRKIDMLIVDGPPARTAWLARYPALPLLRERLSDDAVIVLDDVHRHDERVILRRWLSEYPEYTATVVEHTKGAAALLTR
jgi:predicted O-methyltransferase YrrM